jgi:aminomethyltransferase
MPIGTPFHSRTAVLCASHNWRTWSGYFVASCYDVMHDYEYHAIRNTAGLIDISPLYKYEVRGRDALKLVDRVITRDAAKCAVGQVLYGCLCEDDGAVIQDGPCFASPRSVFVLIWPTRVCAGSSSMRMGWTSRSEVSEQIAALALRDRTPKSFSRLSMSSWQATIFSSHHGQYSDMPVVVSRTGYTGDLGYEIWLNAQDAERIWDVLMEKAGLRHQARRIVSARCGAARSRVYPLSRLHGR